VLVLLAIDIVFVFLLTHHGHLHIEFTNLLVLPLDGHLEIIQLDSQIIDL
jgi:hypothetical protein